MAKRPTGREEMEPIRPMRRKKRRAATREKAIAEALRATVRDLFHETHGVCLSAQDSWTLDLQFTVSADGRWDLNFEPDLLNQLLPQLAAEHAARNVYREGHVYCFECLSSACSHSAPRASREAFFGYGQTGRPIWRDFAQLLIDRNDEQAENLFAETPELCTILQDPDALREKQLSVFGRDSKTYAVMGQLSAGYFSLETWDPLIHEDDRFALTWQVVEARDHRGRPAVHLNTIGVVPGCSSQAEMRADTQFDWIFRARSQAETQLKRVRPAKLRPAKVRPATPGARGRRPAEFDSDQVMSCLRTLASALKQGQRQRRRRTRHAQDRREVQRPVHKAMDDVIHAPAERFFMDLKHHSVVILGPRSRCHVFADSGKHITSFTIARDAVQLRLRKKRWQELNAGERDQFLMRFRDRCDDPPPA